jgi:hypothetical protein
MKGWQPLRDGLATLLPRTQPDHRQDDGHAIDREHDEGRLLDRLGNAEREFGEPERADDRNQKYEPHRKHNRK